MTNKLHVKTGDRVIVISGKSKGVKGKVIEVSPKEGKIIVEGESRINKETGKEEKVGVNIVKKHVKPRNAQDQGGIIEAPAPMYACKVQHFCSKCDKPTRVAHKIVDGKKIRVCTKCGAEL